MSRRRWVDLPLRRKGLVVVSLPLLALVATAITFGVVVRSDHRAQASVTHTVAVQGQLRQVLQLSVDATSGVSGYVATGQDSFLDNYRAGRQALPVALDRLHDMVSDNPAQLERLAVLRSTVTQRFTIVDRILQLSTQPGTSSQLAVLYDQGKAAGDALRSQVTTMLGAEDKLLASRRSHADSTYRWALAVVGLGLVAGLGGGVAAVGLFTSGMARRIQRVADNAGRLEHGEELMPGDTGADEIGRLGDDVERAAGLLALRNRDLGQREATLRAIVTASPDIIAVLRGDGHLQWVNSAVTNVLGHTEAELMEARVLSIHPDDRKLVSGSVHAVLQGDTAELRCRFRARHADGHWVILDCRGRVVAGDDDTEPTLLLIARDVSDRAELETALIEARDVAESANQAKSEFLSRMSHELRTPLNAVLGFAQLLELESLESRQGEYVGHIDKAGRHLLRLVNEVLDISRIETGDLNLSPEPVMVTELLAETLDLVRPLAHAQGVTLDDARAVQCDRYVIADRQRLKQILLNLVANAIKYNRPGGQAWVSCEERPDSRFRLSVTDDGPGIASDLVPLLFTPFERLGAERTGVEGTGVGLALSRRLAEAMGGTLVLDPAVETGASFAVELPLAEGPVERFARLQSPAATPAPAWRDTRSRVVLHVEDNLANLRLIDQVLARRHHVRLIPAMQGRLGLELAHEHRPDLILLDLHLPDIAGEEVLRGLRDDPATAHIPVVIVSADATTTQVKRLLGAGAYAYLTKPIDVRHLLRLTDELFA